jgi:hypothetical protein
MINKLLRFFCSIVTIGLLFFPNAWTAHAVEHYVPPPLTPQLSSDGNSLSYAAPPAVYVADPNPSAERVRIPARFDLLSIPESATATFSITYVANGGADPWGNSCITFPEEAKNAFIAATAIWGSILQSSVPITISACWSNLDSATILGQSGGGYSYRNFTGAPRANTWYISSLANALAGYDQDSTKSDMHITYNKNFSWYYGTDGNTPLTQFDLMSVILHEVAHGLNFSGSMRYSGGTGSWGGASSPSDLVYPMIYDTFMRDGTANPGNLLINTGVYANPFTTLGSALTSDSIWFHGGNAMAANGGQRVKMYAPSTWSSGSSYSHMDYDTFRSTANALMVYAIPTGTARHDPGPIVEGILKDLGWPVGSCLNPFVRRASGSYNALQDAYNGAVDGDTIQSQAVFFSENLDFSRNIAVTIMGGYDCSFSTNVQKSVVNGTVTIRNGTVTIENIIIR